MRPRLRAAVVGAGIGRLHIEAYRRQPDQFDLTAICDIDEPRARELVEAQHIPYVIRLLDILCQRDDVDVIDLCMPPYTKKIPSAFTLKKNERERDDPIHRNQFRTVQKEVHRRNENAGRTFRGGIVG
jgi:hypothetical protein